MPDQIRRANAKAAASKYAPKPDGSAITYGLIAVSVLAVALIFYGVFYSVDMLSQPVALFLAASSRRSSPAWACASGWTASSRRLRRPSTHRAQPGDPTPAGA